MSAWNVQTNRCTGFVGAAGFALTLQVHPAFAQSSPTIRAAAAFAVARDPTAQATAVRVDAVLRDAVETAPDFRRIEPARITSGDPKTREESALERARAALADGRRSYEALALDEAIARLRQAVSLFKTVGPLLGDLSELVDTLTHLGSALVLRGSINEGISIFVELLTIRPSYQPSGLVPTVERVFEQALARMDRAPTGAAEIYSIPPYAAVYLNGIFEGVTPLTLSSLTAGTHYIRLEKTGYTVYGAPLSIAAGQPITSQTRLPDIQRGPELRDLLARGAHEVGQDHMGGALRALSHTLRSDVLLVVAVTQSGSSATLVGVAFDGATSARLATERAVVRIDQERFSREVGALASRLLASVRAGGTVESVPASEASVEATGEPRAFGLGSGGQEAADPYRLQPAAPPTPSEVYLGWTLIGLGGASAAVGAGFGISALLVHSDLRDSEQRSADLPDIQDTGKRNALLADILLFSGLGLAAGGTAILLLSNSSAGASFSRARASIAPHAGGATLTVGANF